MEDGEEQVVRQEDVIRWLGFYLDPKLSFNMHVRNATEKAKRALERFRMLGNTMDRGVSQTHLRHLYLICILPILTYGCAVWWKRSPEFRSTAADMLGSIQIGANPRNAGRSMDPANPRPNTTKGSRQTRSTTQTHPLAKTSTRASQRECIRRTHYRDHLQDQS
jgi:hypothetical protein